MTNEEEPMLRDGSEWIDHEDCIIGNVAGLTSLRNACDAALAHGEYFGGDLGDWVGVRRLETSWFRAPSERQSTRLANAALAGALLGFLGLALIGAYTVFRWFI